MAQIELPPEQEQLLQHCMNGTRGLVLYGLKVLSESSKYTKLSNGEVIAYKWSEMSKLWVPVEERASLEFFTDTAEKLAPLYSTFEMIVDCDPKDSMIKAAREQYPDYVKQCKALKYLVGVCDDVGANAKVWNAIKGALTSSGGAQMDYYSDWLPLKGGNKISLRTGDIVPRTNEDLWTYEINTTGEKPSAPAQAHVQRYFSNICRDANNNVDRDYINYFRKVFGYCMTYELGDKSFFAIIGSTNSGKSDLMTRMQLLLTDGRITTVEPAVFIQTGSNSNHKTHMLDLNNRSMVYVTELSKGSILNTENIKRQSGGDDSRIRVCNAKQTQLVKKGAKLTLVGNFMPVIKGNDDAVDTRLRVLLMNRDLVHLLFDELELNRKTLEFLDTQPGMDAMFYFLLSGAIEYYKDLANGNKYIVMPQVVKDASKSVIEESDSLTVFINEHCETWYENSAEPKVAYEYSRSDFQTNYRAFCIKYTYAKDEISDSKEVMKKLMGITHAAPKSRGPWSGIRPLTIKLSVEQILMANE